MMFLENGSFFPFIFNSRAFKCIFGLEPDIHKSFDLTMIVNTEKVLGSSNELYAIWGVELHLFFTEIMGNVREREKEKEIEKYLYRYREKERDKERQRKRQ